MPYLRGINVFIAVQRNFGYEQLTEYPHPDASSVLISPENSPSCGPRTAPSAPPGSPSSVFSKSSSCSSFGVQKRDPTISVYTPSVPAAQFSLQYNIVHPPEPACLFFFKVFMNGRSVASWGTDPSTRASGAVTRALYKPCANWHHEENGVVLQRQGIESRTFYFAPGLGNVSVADDGGLVEVQAFRAKSCVPRAPRLAEFRGQDQYGITSPSAGLLDHPEEATYFDWILIDPKDSPYSTYRFHYRSLANLRLLNLVPPEVLPGSDRDMNTVPSSSPTEHASRPRTTTNDSLLDNGTSHEVIVKKFIEDEQVNSGKTDSDALTAALTLLDLSMGGGQRRPLPPLPGTK